MRKKRNKIDQDNKNWSKFWMINAFLRSKGEAGGDIAWIGRGERGCLAFFANAVIWKKVAAVIHFFSIGKGLRINCRLRHA